MVRSKRPKLTLYPPKRNEPACAHCFRAIAYVCRCLSVSVGVRWCIGSLKGGLAPFATEASKPLHLTPYGPLELPVHNCSCHLFLSLCIERPIRVCLDLDVSNLMEGEQHCLLLERNSFTRLTSHTMSVVPTPKSESKPIALPRLASTITMPVIAREYLDLSHKPPGARGRRTHPRTST